MVSVEREFEPQDVVSIAGPEGREFARGIANCASREASASIARADVGDAPGAGQRRKAGVLVTRDNIVILEGLPENNIEPATARAES